MIGISVEESQLFRLLSGFFGVERVIPQMSVLAACGGSLPSNLHESELSLESWAKSNKCLFTVVNEADEPKLVVEFLGGSSEVVEVAELERQQRLEQLLNASSVLYIRISKSEFSEMLDPRHKLDLYSLLKAKLSDLSSGDSV